MAPVHVNGGVHTARKQHQRICAPNLRARIQCGLGLKLVTALLLHCVSTALIFSSFLLGLCPKSARNAPFVFCCHFSPKMQQKNCRCVETRSYTNQKKQCKGLRAKYARNSMSTFNKVKKFEAPMCRILKAYSALRALRYHQQLKRAAWDLCPVVFTAPQRAMMPDCLIPDSTVFLTEAGLLALSPLAVAKCGQMCLVLVLCVRGCRA